MAFGGRSGQDVSGFSVGKVDYVRVMTAFSCKGHESPVVFFCGVDALDDMGWMETKPGRTERELERTRRALFYVGATRAMVRQYVSGLAGARFTRVAAEYARTLAGGTRSISAPMRGGRAKAGRSEPAVRQRAGRAVPFR